MTHRKPNLERGSSPIVASDDIAAILHREGRDALGVFTPLILGHYCQRLAGEVADFARDIMATKGVDEETANSVAARLATLGLGQFVNIAEFGYAQRVLEERIGFEPLPNSPQPIDS